MRKLFCVILLGMAVTGTGYAQALSAEEKMEKGMLLYDSGNYTAALETYQEALKQDGGNPEILYEMSLAYFALGDMDNTIRYSDAVVKKRGASPRLRAQALVNKGSALDIQEKPEQAVKVYQKAIKLDAGYYMAYYNLGLTLYNQKNYKQAESALLKTVQLNPSHSSSHLLLGYIKQAQKQRVQSLLAFYNFLLLEPKTERASVAFSQLQRMQQEGVSKGDGNAINIMVSADKLDDNPFSAAELMVSMMQGANTLEAKEGKTREQLFFENTQSLFNILAELKKDREDFWWSYYVDFFHEMSLDKNVEAFSYYINPSVESQTWLNEHPDKVEQLTNWHRNYKR
jgi:tetratricopeptide (TPR) repeat protein